MLNLFGKPHARGGFCDGVNRRDFLTIGGTLFGGCLALPNLLAAEAKAGIKTSHKAVINIYLPGGPPHIAKMMDKFVIIRSLVNSSGDHEAYQCMTGRPRTPANNGFWPAFSSWVSKVQGQADAAVPANVSLMYPTGERRWGYA